MLPTRNPARLTRIIPKGSIFLRQNEFAIRESGAMYDSKQYP